MMNTNMDYESIAAAGSLLGSGAVVVMDDSTDMVKVLQRISRFYFSESCGQCTPCREGTGWLYRMLCRIVEGKGRQEDIDRLDDVATKIEGRTICALGDAAAMPVRLMSMTSQGPQPIHPVTLGCVEGPGSPVEGAQDIIQKAMTKASSQQ